MLILSSDTQHLRSTPAMRMTGVPSINCAASRPLHTHNFRCRPQFRASRDCSSRAVLSPSFVETAVPTPIEEPSELGWRTNFRDTYVRGKMIGSGSFGQVHVGVHQDSGMEVAVKTLPKVRGKLTRERTLDKIEREMHMLQHMQGCRGVVRLLECFEDLSTVQIVMEICGSDLQKHVEAHGPLDERTLAMAAFETLKIVKACHEQGILHGDVKPANFCIKQIQQNGTLKLRAIDFGCSQFLGARRLSKRTGTPIFMAPEIFGRDYAEQADVWGVGVMLYWLFCQQFPFFKSQERVKQAKLEEVAEAVRSASIAYDFGPWRSVSPEGLDFIQRCLIRPEEQRITVAEALQHPWFSKFLSLEERTFVSPTLTTSAAA